jgi:hypothetical protein
LGLEHFAARPGFRIGSRQSGSSWGDLLGLCFVVEVRRGRAER